MNVNIFVAVMAAVFFIFVKTSHAAPIEITDARATANYWLSRTTNGDEIILDAESIEALNAFLRERDTYAAVLENYPATVSADYLIDKIYRLVGDMQISGSPAVMDNLNLDAIDDTVAVRYAVTVTRANIRLLPVPPTGDRYDNLQGTALDPAEAVAVLWDSADSKFVFAQARNYFGWIDKTQLAFTDRAAWLNYINPENFLVVTSNKKYVKVNGNRLLFQMGAKIPLVDGKARIPVSVNGTLREVTVKIHSDDTVNLGWLDCTANNFIRQSFKFLGDVYGWGGLDNSVDCSSFVGDVYRSMGIEIPRDADRQESAVPIFAVFNDVSRRERIDIVSRSPVGALLFKPGHVLMRLGNDDSGTPIVIHAASSYFSNGYKIYVRKVLVSDLSYENGAGIATIDGLTGIGVAK